MVEQYALEIIEGGPKFSPEEVRALGIPVIDIKESTIHGCVSCHGQRWEFMIPFSKAREIIRQGLVQRVFEDESALPGKETPAALPSCGRSTSHVLHQPKS